MKLFVCGLAVCALLLGAGVSFGSETTLSGGVLSTLDSRVDETDASSADAIHEMYGRYVDSLNNAQFDVDIYGRITTQFELTLATGARWLVTFPQTLRPDAFGGYSARGTVRGLWSTGTCTYPANIQIVPGFNGAVDVTVLLPQTYQSNCNYAGTHQVLWNMVRY